MSEGAKPVKGVLGSTRPVSVAALVGAITWLAGGVTSSRHVPAAAGLTVNAPDAVTGTAIAVLPGGVALRSTALNCGGLTVAI